MMGVKDWVAWHRGYEDPSSSLSARLRRVRYHLSRAIDRAPQGPVSVVSLCAGQGLDVIGVLPDHPRRDDVRAVLVEADATNAALARRAATDAGLAQVDVRQADASLVTSLRTRCPRAYSCCAASSATSARATSSAPSRPRRPYAPRARR
jgi:hypothetical protein